VLDNELAKPDRATVPHKQPDVSVFIKGVVSEFSNRKKGEVKK